MRKVIAAAMALALTACASSSVLVGNKRPEIDPESVRVYLQPPAKFEQVALLEASSAASMALTSRQKTNKVIARLKEEAAALGANGILLQGMGNEYGGSVTSATGNVYGSGFTGMGVSAPVMHKAGTAIAIYVPPGAESPAEIQQAPVVTPQQGAATECVACQKILKDDGN